jgi:parallel beta-helix repeat protein
MRLHHSSSPTRPAPWHLRWIRLVASLVIGIASVVCSTRAFGQTYVVTSSADAGPGSFRQALLDANTGSPAWQRWIVFALPGGNVVSLASPLPAVTVPMLIDGFTIPNGGPAVLTPAPPIRVTLDGGGTVPVGLEIRASNVTVRGLAIGRFTSGVRIVGAVSMVRIEGSFVGTDTSGSLARRNGVGIELVDSGGAPSQVYVGGQPGTGYANVISGNGDGVVVATSATQVTISGNRIGTNAVGVAALPNGRGIVVTGAGATGAGHMIGGAYPNVIAGNTGPGIALLRATGVEVDGNFIGVTPTESVLPNGGDGVVLGDGAAGMEASGTRVKGNLIAGNGRNGIVVRRGSGNALKGNRFWNNGLLGIDLGDDGNDVNDAGDTDDGPNGRQNSIVLRPSSWQLVDATFTGAASVSVTVNFFASHACDPSDHGEGENLLVESYRSTDAAGVFEMSLGGSLPPGFTAVTAVVTSDIEGTSEFSNCVVLTQPTGTLSGTVTLDGSPLAGVRVALGGDLKGERVTGPDGTYSFANLPRGGAYTLDPSHDDYSFSPAGISMGLINGSHVQNFAARRTLTLTGRISDIENSSLEGVAVILAGHRAGAVATDADGRYRFGGLPLDGTFTVTPAKEGFTFSPSVRSFANLTTSPSESSMGFSALTGSYTRYFAEGATGGFFDTQFELLNSTTTDTTATFEFLLAEGSTVPHAVPVKAQSRATVRPADVKGLQVAEFSTVVRSAVPLTVDRSMTWDATGYGSHAETAVRVPASRWYLAEGATIGGFNLFYLLQNPSQFVTNATVTYLLPSEPPLHKVYVLPPFSRTNIWVNQEDPRLAAAEVSAVVDSFFPIIVERAMYRNLPGQLFGAGHASAGITDARTTWFLAEGSTGPYFDLFVLVANPSLTPASITARFLLPDGSTRSKDYVVPPQSRFNIWVDEEELPAGSGLKPLADTAVSTTITSTNDVPIVVERAMWWPGTGDTWQEGHNSPATALAGTRWGIAGGQEGGPAAVETYVLVANTSASEGSALVTLYFEDGTTAERVYSLRPTSRFNVAVAVEFPQSRGRRYGVTVESIGTSPAPIVVERATYASANGTPWGSGSVTLASRLR